MGKKCSNPKKCPYCQKRLKRKQRRQAGVTTEQLREAQRVLNEAPVPTKGRYLYDPVDGLIGPFDAD